MNKNYIVDNLLAYILTRQFETFTVKFKQFYYKLIINLFLTH